MTERNLPRLLAEISRPDDTDIVIDQVIMAFEVVRYNDLGRIVSRRVPLLNKFTVERALTRALLADLQARDERGR